MQKSFADKPFKLLDVGAGNHSASRIVSLFPNCEYYGLDRDKTYNNSGHDFSVMKDFYELDLTALEYTIIPGQFFDGIWMAHVIEHLHNGDEVLPGLIQKLKPGGFFYIEYPGGKSTTLPSMKDTLNFKDDATHVRLYSVPELTTIFEANGCTVIQGHKKKLVLYRFPAFESCYFTSPEGICTRKCFLGFTGVCRISMGKEKIINFFCSGTH